MGFSGARFALFDLSTGRTLCFFETGEHQSFSVSFAPDDSFLAADGYLFDAATGRRLARLGPRYCVAFSPNFAEVALAAPGGFPEPEVRRLTVGATRGLTMLYGLRTSATRLTIAANSRVLAAVSQDWRVGVWDLESGRQLRIFDLPEGLVADNAAVALSSDGAKVAAASGESVCLWDVATGARLGDWPLPPGLCNALAFRDDGGLLLARSELTTVSEYPAQPFVYPKHPRIVHVRNLLGPSPTAPSRSITTFAAHVYEIVMTPDGRNLVINGVTPTGSGDERTVRLYDALDGRERGHWRVGHRNPNYSVFSDPRGVCFSASINEGSLDLFDVATGTRRSTSIPSAFALGPNGSLRYRCRYGEPRSVFNISREGRGEPLLSFAHLDARPTARFSADGRFLAFETISGAVGVLDIPKMRRNLDRIGLGW